MGNRVANLLSRIVALEERFNLPPSGGRPEQRRRSDLIRCATLLRVRLYSLRSFPPSELNAIEEQLRSTSEKQESPRPVVHVQASKDIFKLLEDLHEEIFGYEVCLQSHA